MTMRRRMKGDHFRLQRWEEDGLWHWELIRGGSPHGAIARSSQGYASPSAAERAMRSACVAARGAARGRVNAYAGVLRIDKRDSLRPRRK